MLQVPIEKYAPVSKGSSNVNVTFNLFMQLNLNIKFQCTVTLTGVPNNGSLKSWSIFLTELTEPTSDSAFTTSSSITATFLRTTPTNA